MLSRQQLHWQMNQGRGHVELHLMNEAQILDDATVDVDVSGEGADEVKKDGKNLVIRAMMAGFEFMGNKPKGIALHNDHASLRQFLNNQSQVQYLH